MKTHSKEMKLNKIVNNFLDEVCSLPNLTHDQWAELSNTLIHPYEAPFIPDAVNLLRSFYQTEDTWICAKGNTFAKYVQTYTEFEKPLSRSKIGLKHAVDIVKFILDNRKFLIY